MPRPERAVQADAGPVESFAVRLRELRRQAGNPGYRQLAVQAGYSAATLANAAGGLQLPSLAVTLAFVRACDGDVGAWAQWWQEVAAEVAVLRAAAKASGDAPYLGLTGYDVGDADRFFGRDRLVAEVVRLLGRQRFLAVFGVSGAGKSSLLRAGVVPALTGDASPHDDGTGPTRAESRTGSAGGFIPVLVTPGVRPVETLHEKVSTVPSDAAVLLVVDQFEEVFTLCPDPAERAALVASLSALVSDPGARTRVVLGVRADYYARCTELPGLAALLAGASVPVGPLSEDELRDVVCGPARRAGLSVERALVSTILADASGQPGPLPLVSHALLETWRQRRSDVLTAAGYESTGGVAGAVARTAERVYAGFAADQRETARHVLVRLVTLGEGVEDVRRRVRRGELDFTHVEAVLDRLATARLVVLGEDSVEIAHEALIRAWPRLRGWLTADRETLRAHRQLTEDAQLWDSLHRDSEILYGGARLSAWEGHGLEHLNGLERAFLAVSRDQQAREQAVRRRRRRLALVGLTGAAVALSLLAGLARIEANRAESERDLAFSRQLVAEAANNDDPRTALMLAVAAQHIHDDEDTRNSLVGLLTATHYAGTLTGHRREIRTVAFSPDGRMLATGAEDRTVILWDVTDRARPVRLGVPLSGHRDKVTAVAFSPDGRTVATGSEDRTVILWDLTDRAHPVRLGVPLSGHRDKVTAVAFNPNGRTVATGSEDRTAILWDVTDRARPTQLGAPLTGHGYPIASVTFSPDGRTVATGSWDRTAILWDLTDRARPTQLGAPLTGHRDAITAVTFSPDGRTVATGSWDRTAILWTVAERGRPARLGVPLTGHRDVLTAVAFSPDGRTLATGSIDGTVIVRDVADRGRPVRLGAPLSGHRDKVTAVAFSPDGRTLATGSVDGTVILWDVTDRSRPVRAGAPLASHGGTVRSTAFSPDGRTLATGGEDRTVILWDVTDRSRPVRAGAPLTGHAGTVRSTVFSPDGRTVATGSWDRTVILWDVTDRARPVQLGVPVTGHDGVLVSVVFSPDGRTLATGSWDRTAILWDLTELNTLLDRPAAYACDVTGRGLSRDEWIRSLPKLPYRTTCPRPNPRAHGPQQHAARRPATQIVAVWRRPP